MTDTLALIEAAHNGDKSAREKIFYLNRGLIYSVARRFSGRGVEMEDLIQIGSIGLLKAVDYFDNTFKVRFSTYAVPMIVGEIRRYLRDDGMIKVSRSLKEKNAEIGRVKELLEKNLGREPTVQEIAKETGITLEELTFVVESGYEVESLQKKVYQGDGSELFLQDKISEEEDGHEKIINRMFLEALLSELEENEKKIITMRYFRDMTQVQIAEKMGMTQVQISRIEKKILKALRKKCTFLL